MANFDNPLAQMEAMPEPTPKKTSKRRQAKKFENPLDELSVTEKAKATGSSLVAGQYVRRTFTYTPKQLARIKEIARTLHISETGIARWLIDEGLGQWEAGVRPEVAQQTVRLEPKLKYS